MLKSCYLFQSVDEVNKPLPFDQPQSFPQRFVYRGILDLRSNVQPERIPGADSSSNHMPKAPVFFAQPGIPVGFLSPCCALAFFEEPSHVLLKRWRNQVHLPCCMFRQGSLHHVVEPRQPMKISLFQNVPEVFFVRRIDFQLPHHPIEIETPWLPRVWGSRPFILAKIENKLSCVSPETCRYSSGRRALEIHPNGPKRHASLRA